MTGPVRMAVSAGVATITLDNPENRNALSVELVDGLGSSLEAAMADDATRVVVLTNEGPAFCAGADLKARYGGGNPTMHTLASIFETMLDGPKPVVGRIAGHCTGGGVGLAAACDVSVVVEDVTFGFTEARLGLAPAVISVVCLPKLRRGDASELFLRAVRFDGARAAAVGLVNHAVPRDALDAAVDEVVADLLRGGPTALAACKQLVARVPDMDRAGAFGWTSELSAGLFGAPEAAEGMASFREKRDPSWVPQDRARSTGTAAAQERRPPVSN